MTRGFLRKSKSFVRLGSVESELTNRAARFDFIADFEQINDVPGDGAARLALHGQLDVVAFIRRRLVS